MAVAEKIALSLLEREGIAGIWQLHIDAAELHREGHRDSACSLIEIADAAEEIFWRRVRKAAAFPVS